MSILKHTKVLHGQCEICGHYGDDCTGAKLPIFVAVKSAVMRGSEHIATAISKTMAKRIANALNHWKTNDEGV